MLTLLFFLLVLTLGLACLKIIDPEHKLELEAAIAAAVIVGLTLAGFFICVAGLIFHSLWLGLALFGFFSLAVGARQFKYLRDFFVSALGILKKFRPKWLHVFVCLSLFVYLAIVYQVISISPYDGVPQGILKGWGDVAYHLNIIETLHYADPFVLNQPIAGGQPLTYPFLIDFFSAILRKLGLGIFWAFEWPVLILGAALYVIVFSFGKYLFKKSLYGLLLAVLTFFGAGLGIIWFGADLNHAFASGGLNAVWNTLQHLPHEYTHLDSRTGGKPSGFDIPLNIVWIVPAISFFSHQRSFVLGAGLSLLMLFGIFLYREDKKTLPWWIMLAGFLPISHPHSFFASAILLSVMFLLYAKGMWKEWLAGGISAILIAAPQILYLNSGAKFVGSGAGQSFFKPWLGWMMCTHRVSWLVCDPGVAGTDTNFLLFVTKNFGIVFWVWILALLIFVFRSWKLHETKILVIPSIVMFIVPNIVLLQPWEFDNNKALFYWWFLAIILCLSVIHGLEHLKDKKIFISALAIFMFLAASAGAIDVLNRLYHWSDNHYGYYGQAEIRVADWIRVNTKPNDIFLTNDGANNFVPMLAGRPIYLGFPGWVWTQGRNALVQERQQKINNFFATGNPAAICNDGVRYLMWERPFLETYPQAANFNPTTVGSVVYGQNAPTGPRTIFKLNCP